MVVAAKNSVSGVSAIGTYVQYPKNNILIVETIDLYIEIIDTGKGSGICGSLGYISTLRFFQCHLIKLKCIIFLM